jgi:hypothetical protein
MGMRNQYVPKLPGGPSNFLDALEDLLIITRHPGINEGEVFPGQKVTIGSALAHKINIVKNLSHLSHPALRFPRTTDNHTQKRFFSHKQGKAHFLPLRALVDKNI